MNHGAITMQQPSADFDQNLVCKDAVRDPHAYFARLREHDPVYWNDRHRAWVLTRHSDIGTALRSTVLTAERITPFASAVQTAADSDNVDATFQVLKDWLVFKDPPEHTRLRRLVARAFTPTVVLSAPSTRSARRSTNWRLNSMATSTSFVSSRSTARSGDRGDARRTAR